MQGWRFFFVEFLLVTSQAIVSNADTAYDIVVLERARGRHSYGRIIVVDSSVVGTISYFLMEISDEF